MNWIWDPDKNRENRQKHRLSFETAQLVFDDPLARTREDPFPHEQRWQTVGLVGSMTLFVVHTRAEFDFVSGEETGRIVSARKATRQERNAYEEGYF